VNTPVIVTLVILLGALTGVFSFMGLRHRRRGQRIAEFVASIGMEYRRTDVHRLAGGHEDLALLSAGHARRAENIAWGRMGGVPTIAFDFRYEIGHGLQRMTRFYSVVILDLPHTIDPVLLWHEGDLEWAPLLAKLAEHQLDRWVFSGDGDQAQRMARACGPLGSLPVSVQILDGMLMFCCPTRTEGTEYERLLKNAESVALRISGPGSVDASGRPASDKAMQIIENTEPAC
jgi:hypothetical protein